MDATSAAAAAAATAFLHVIRQEAPDQDQEEEKNNSLWGGPEGADKVGIAVGIVAGLILLGLFISGLYHNCFRRCLRALRRKRALRAQEDEAQADNPSRAEEGRRHHHHHRRRQEDLESQMPDRTPAVYDRGNPYAADDDDSHADIAAPAAPAVPDASPVLHHPRPQRPDRAYNPPWTHLNQCSDRSGEDRWTDIPLNDIQGPASYPAPTRLLAPVPYPAAGLQSGRHGGRGDSDEVVRGQATKPGYWGPV